MSSPSPLTPIIGRVPYRIALAGGWIDQPFVSEKNPDDVGSMVVVSVEPEFRFMDRCGIAGSTRRIAEELWGGIPDRDPAELVRELYEEENKNRVDPSGAQDMIGLIYPGVNRLDFDFSHEAGLYPRHIESCNDPAVARWLQEHIWVLPVLQRPDGYNPLEVKNLDPEWIRRLGRSGRDCYDAILGMDTVALGRSMNECMLCWEKILPRVVAHPVIKIDLLELLGYYREHYPGAMFSGCGGGYFFIVSDNPVPGAFRLTVRVRSDLR
jgi:hypothetical protein